MVSSLCRAFCMRLPSVAESGPETIEHISKCFSARINCSRMKIASLDYTKEALECLLSEILCGPICYRYFHVSEGSE